MNTKRMFSMFVLVLGVYLSIVSPASAALSQPTFDINPNPGYVDEPVTLTDTSGSSGLHEWDCDFSGVDSEFEAQQTGDSASCVYHQPTGTAVAQRVTEGSNSLIYDEGLTIYSRSDKPYDTKLAGSTRVNLPGTVAFQTPKSQFDVVCWTGGQQCPAYVADRTGPDAGGLYTHFVRIENAPAGGSIQLDTIASNGNGQDDRKPFTLTVGSNANQPFGLVSRTMFVCRPQEDRHGDPTGRAEAGALMEYYQSGGQDPAKVTVKLQRKSKVTGKWLKVTKEVGGPDAAAFSPYLLKEVAGFAAVKESKLTTQKYRIKSTVSAGTFVPKKTKTVRLTPPKCG